jgi:hypothetical protein
MTDSEGNPRSARRGLKGQSMVAARAPRDRDPFLVITLEREVRPELVRPLVAAFASFTDGAVVQAGEAAPGRPWLLPALVAIAFRAGLNHRLVLQELQPEAPSAIRAALAALYRELNEIATDAASGALMPLSLDFDIRPRATIRFVFGSGLDAEQLENAFTLIPETRAAAGARLQRTKDLLDSVNGRSAPMAEEYSLTLVHLYSDPALGWQTIA